LHRGLINLVVTKVFAGEGLDTDLLDRAERVEAQLPGVRLHDSADLHRGLWSGFVDDLDTARAALQRCISRARAAGDDHPLCIFLSYLASVEELAGDYTAAAAALDAERAVAQWHDWPISPWHLKPRCELLIASGDLDGAVRVADASLPDDDSVRALYRYMGACVRGKVSAWRGDPASTVRHLESAAAHADRLEWADPGLRDRIEALLAEAYVALGRLAEASDIAARLREVGDRMSRPVLVGDASRISALMAVQRGDLDAAAAVARQAVAAHESAPMRPALAGSLLVLGQIERRRKARKESRDALRRAHDLATICGHQPLTAATERELSRVAAGRSGDTLTATEQRVADLIVSGATNREVAAALFVSVRTIETHVASIYRKIGVRSRAELGLRHFGTSGR
jgi:ATP/maltotriose-dependent transcriptional regulator MalT